LIDGGRPIGAGQERPLPVGHVVKILGVLLDTAGTNRRPRPSSGRLSEVG